MSCARFGMNVRSRMNGIIFALWNGEQMLR
jgi:hypothetical protein